MLRLLSQVPTDESALGLVLLSDLTSMLPHDATFDFSVSGVSVGSAAGCLKIGLLIDNSSFTTHTSLRCEVRGLPAGYHLLRAFLLEQDTASAAGRAGSPSWLCVKSPLAYVEAEFFVESPSMPETRSFMFGQPSLCYIAPRDSLPTSSLSSIVVDWFVNNCAVSAGPSGFGVNVYVNGGLLGCVREWSAFHVKGLEDARGKLRIRLVLVNPAGEEVLFPQYNADQQEIILTS